MSIDELQIIHSGWAQRVQKLSGVEFFDPQRLSRTHRQAIDVAPIKPHINNKMCAVDQDPNHGLPATVTGLGTAPGLLDDGAALSLSWTPAPLEPLPWLLLLQNLLKGVSPTAFPLLPCTDSDRFPIPGCALAGHRNQWIA